MDKSMAALLGAMGALAATGSAPAASQPVHPPASTEDILHAASYADLLRPIPNALARLAAVQAGEMDGSLVNDAAPMVRDVGYHHHHHHHHHRRYVRRYHHHHHHHHHDVARLLNHLLVR
jgi:hypothetical protein